ncbi:MAG: hypothetical protein IJJ22_00455 [Oscillospiraceae bacterium]|nr:hypothetical protein [Oscillospiraceae bacterium]
MQKEWFRLDTAALIFPATARRDWCNAFRLSVSLKEPVDPEILQRAVDDMAARFPTFFVTLHRGFFWYYLEKSRERVTVRPDYAYPLTFMSRRELRKNCLRVLWYKNRIALEFFHSLTDGHGGSVFLCTLAAHYLELKYGISIPCGDLILDLSQQPTERELEDSFLQNAAEVAAPREEQPSFRLSGTREEGGFRHLTTGIVDTEALLDAAHRYKVSVTAFLAAVMAESIIGMQDERRPRRRQKPVKITLPVDLRRLYGSETLRNFALVVNPGVDPRFGDYSLDQLCSAVYHQLCAGATPQNMAGMIAANVQPQQLIVLQLAPVFIKDLVMDLVYRRSGESGGSINVSNLGAMKLPEVMQQYVERMEFIIGPQRSYPNNCSVLSLGGKTYINMIRNIRESELEQRFFSRLVELGIAVDIESNRR